MVPAADRQLLRDLARRVAEIAALPEVQNRITLFTKHNSLQPVRPLILVFPEGSWAELLPGSDLQCQSDRGRAMENQLRQRIYTYEHFHSDNPITNEWIVGKAIRNSGWGLAAQHVAATHARGAWAFDPVIHEPEDLDQIQMPQISHDEEASAKSLEAHQELFGDILDVKQRGIQHISFHLMNLYTGWRGLEQVYMDMYEDPEMLHAGLQRITDGYRGMIEQYVAQNLLSFNNDNTYHSSGGNGYTTDLPLPDCDPEHVRTCDLWASAESQEMSEISPSHHEEFAMRYERQLLEPFGLTGYGCCEALHDRLDRVTALPHMRRISISPFADVDITAPQLKGDYIWSWKPNPWHLVGNFAPDAIRTHLQHTLDLAAEHGCVLEMILKDTHTCEHHPERFTAWTRIAAELVGR